MSLEVISPDVLGDLMLTDVVYPVVNSPDVSIAHRTLLEVNALAELWKTVKHSSVSDMEAVCESLTSSLSSEHILKDVQWFNTSVINPENCNEWGPIGKIIAEAMLEATAESINAVVTSAATNIKKAKSVFVPADQALKTHSFSKQLYSLQAGSVIPTYHQAKEMLNVAQRCIDFATLATAETATPSEKISQRLIDTAAALRVNVGDNENDIRLEYARSITSGFETLFICEDNCHKDKKLIACGWDSTSIGDVVSELRRLVCTDLPAPTLPIAAMIENPAAFARGVSKLELALVALETHYSNFLTTTRHIGYLCAKALQHTKPLQ